MSNYNETLKKYKETANIAFKNFVTLLGLNSELFEHLYNMKLEISTLDDGLCALYDSNKFKIIINKSFLKELNLDNEFSIQLVTTIVHEMIHANRTILINNGFNSINAEEKNEDELIKYYQLTNKDNVEEYNDLLYEISSNFNISNLSIVPIKIRKKNNLLSIIAYDKKSKNYFKYNNIKFDLKTNDYSFYVNKLSEILLNIEPDDIVYTFDDELNKDSIIPLISDYYHKYDNRIVKEDNLSMQKYKNQLDRNSFRAKVLLNKQFNFEETITETIANYIVLSMNYDELNLEKINEFIQKTCTTEVKICSTLISKMGIDTIKWFIISAYEDVYNDKIREQFKENYDKLLSNISELYESVILDDKPDEEIVNDTLDLINQKTK